MDQTAPTISDREVRVRLLEAASRMPYADGKAVLGTAKVWYDWIIEPPKGRTARRLSLPRK